MSKSKVPFEQWDAVMRTMIAYNKTMSRVHGGSEDGECEVELPELPLPVMESAPRVVVKRVYVHRRVKRLGREVKRTRDPIVGSLRGSIIPWMFGARDERMEALVGISAVEFREYIASKFGEGMNWQNHGYWHLDHVRPVSSFDHRDEAQVRECWHYTNFQPLWGRINLKKGAKLNYVQETSSHAQVA